MNPVGPHALGLLIRSLDAADSRIVADDLDPDDREALELLREHGAVVLAADMRAVMCPWCGEHDVAPQRRADRLQALCPDCGYVTITNPVLQAWRADPDWVLGRLRGAFGIAARQASRVLVPDTLWQVGQPTTRKRKRQVLFARRLAQNNVQHDLREALQASAPPDDTVLVGTTARSAARLEGFALPYVQLAEIVHWRSGTFELEAERWDSLLPSVQQSASEHGSGGFFDHYRRAVIDGEEFRFSIQQARVFEYLDQAGGQKCHKDSIMASIRSTQKNPVELFRHNQRQHEGFQRRVVYDEHGYYWLKRR